MMKTSQPITLSQDELQHLLEPLIRRIIREELSRFVEQQPDVVFLHPDMPLYADMEEITQRKAADGIELFSSQEVWDE
ncbi:hypothetical protein GF339_14515 [candidate division KSB3 bacterium]|uniref:Uncharacterized protein n=1 Tax=candidate division KSB3 bacterium TaxID=2044937 RepID=A0A9D5JX83_9BACT|nr:hypothetical protein [candidate division KSB3 bacterium]MBD3325795.1 hypothetical protein [candidate division KSB3 bacterium]